MSEVSPKHVLQNGMAALMGLLPSTWEMRLGGLDPGQVPDLGDDDLWLTLTSNQGGIYSQLLVEVMSRVTPLAARDLVQLRRQGQRWSRGGEPVLLVMAPWLSRSVRQILREGDVAYLDLTGNAFLRITNPAVFIHTDGASRDPNPPASEERRALSGPKALRLVRLLVDAAPPVRAADLARAAELSAGYVTRVLATLEDQGLIRRGHRRVETVDWQALLRARAEQSPDLLRSGIPLLAPSGIDDLLVEVRSTLPDQTLVTGPYAAAKVSPVTVGGQLLLYPTGWSLANPGNLSGHLQNLAGAVNPGVIADLLGEAGALPTDRGADVVVLNPLDPVAVRWGARHVNGLWHVALSQLVLDSLTGNGRMPAEGEAVLHHMARTESAWRAKSLADLPRGYFRGQILPGVASPPPEST